MNDERDENISNRIPVPRGELDLALKCIDETVSNRIENYAPRELQQQEQEPIEKEQISEGKKTSIESESESDSDSLQKSLSLLKTQILTSLHSTIENSVVPMEEQKYNKKFIKYDTPMKRSIEKAEIDEDEMSLDDDDDIDSISDDDSYTSMDESESEDEEDLLDKAALQRAKKLRELVRQKAADTKAIKDAKISKLLKHVMTELNEWNRINDEQAQLFRNQNGSKSDQGDQTKTFDDTYQRLEKMKTSLSKLTSTLH